VLHCGDTLEGFYLTTLTTVDVATGWTECQAVAGKTQTRVAGALHRIRTRLPMALRELHTDNGSEFIDEQLYPYCQREGIRFTRARPCKKNDQAYLGQKNWSAVRHAVDYAPYSSRPAFTRLGSSTSWSGSTATSSSRCTSWSPKNGRGLRCARATMSPRPRINGCWPVANSRHRRGSSSPPLHDRLDPVHLQQQIADAQRALFAERELPKTSRAAQQHARLRASAADPTAPHEEATTP
jgi:hypothetical protein